MARIELNKEQMAHLRNVNVKLNLKTDFIKKKKINQNYIFEGNWINLDLSKEYKEILFKYIPIYRIESFFYNLFSYILKKNYSKDFFRINRDGLFYDFQMATEKILYDEASIIFDESFLKDENFIVNFEWDNRFKLYSKHFKYIVDDILSLINYDTENNIKKFIGVDKDENPYLSTNAHMFAQQLAIIGYSIATNRIIDNLDNDNYFGLELMNYNDKTDLIIHLTPLGMLECIELFDDLNQEQRRIEFENQIHKIGLKMIDSLELKATLQTSALITLNDNIFKHYKTDEVSASESLSGRTNNHFIKSVVVETQTNFTKI